MPQMEAIGLSNTVLPLAVLVALTLILPRYLVNREARSHVTVAKAMVAVAALLFCAGFVISMILAQLRGFAVVRHLVDFPQVGWMLHARLSLLSALVWGPILLLVWFSLAQRVEARRGLDIVQADHKATGTKPEDDG